MRSFSDFDLDGINTGIEKGPAKNDRSFFHRPFVVVRMIYRESCAIIP